MNLETRLAAIRNAIAAGAWPEASAMLRDSIASVPYVQRGKLVPLLEEVADHDDDASAVLAVVLVNGLGVRANIPKGQAIFTRLLGSGDKEIVGQARSALGSIAQGLYGGKPDWALALHHYRRGAEIGTGECAFNAGVLYANGAEGVEADHALAERHYRIAMASSDDGSAAAARSNLAFMLVMDGRRERFAEAIALLREAAEAGDEKAQKVLPHIVDDDESFEELRRILLAGDRTHTGESFHSVYWKPGDAPVAVVPVDMRRPQLVADALERQFGQLRAMDAKRIAAVLYGFATWDAMRSAFELGGPGTPDDDVDAREHQRREEYQTFALRRELDCDYYTAEVALSLLRPTWRTGAPSLAKLEETMQDRLFQVSQQEMIAQSAGLMKALGIEGEPADFMDRIRLSKPVRADLWLDALHELGWSFSRRHKNGLAKHGDKIATAVDAAKRKWPVYVTPIMGGDEHDVQALELRERIQEITERAVLLHASICMVGDPEGDILVMGGSLLKDGAWKDFCLTEGGLDQALADFGRLDDDFESLLAERAMAEPEKLARRLMGGGSELLKIMKAVESGLGGFGP